MAGDGPFAAAAGAASQLRRKVRRLRSAGVGGLETTDPALIALKASVFAPQTYATDVDDINCLVSSPRCIKCRGPTARMRRMRPASSRWASISAAFRPTHSADRCFRRGHRASRRRASPRTRPQDRTLPRRYREHRAFFDTDIEDFQAQVVNADVGVFCAATLRMPIASVCAGSSSTAVRG